MDSFAQSPIIPIAIMLAIFYVIVLMPMKRQRKKVREFQESLKVNDKVITTSGIHGLITRVSETSVQLQISETPKVRIEVSRQAIGGYQGQEPVVQQPDA